MVENEKSDSKKQDDQHHAKNAPIMNESQVSGRRGSFSGAFLKPEIVNNPQVFTRENWPPTPMPGTQADAEYRKIIENKSIHKPH